MPKLYIIGAGCSKNYSEGITDVPGLESPVDSNFFKMAKKVIVKKSVGADLKFALSNILMDLYHLYGWPPEVNLAGPPDVEKEEYLAIFDDSRLSLENIMTMFSMESDIFTKPWFMFGYHERDSVGITQLGALVELVAVTIDEALRGPLCKKHQKLANLMMPSDIVFSYNYDILMDNALRDCGKLTDKGYLLDFHKVFSRGAWEEPEGDSSQVSIIKLHGSLNWIRCSYCGSTFLLREKTGAWSSVQNDCPRCRQRYFLERLIVPPLLNKNYLDREINYLWREARQLLTRINEIVIIGYSLPPTDFASEVLLSSIPWEVRRNIPVTVVNPDDRVKDRFSRIFNPDKIRMKQDLNEYLKSD